MKLRGHPGAHLAYCLNVHRGESWAEQLAAVRGPGAEVRCRVAPDAPFALGLRLSDRASRDLEAVRDDGPRIREELGGLGFYVLTINAFPFGAFHGRRVKELVYAPDWRSPERLAYTLRVADAAAALAPAGGGSVSLSTVPGTYKAWIRGDEDREAMVRNLATAAAHLHGIEAAGGARLHLGLEPEPDCFLETTDECCAFFPDLVERGGAWLAARQGWSKPGAEAAIRRHIGVCVDTCHLAVEFEDPTDAVRRLSAAGILISKVQLSAAPVCGAADAAALAAFDDPVYLHQVKVRGADGRVRGYADLGEALAAHARSGDGEWRVHVHVPLYWDGAGTAMRSTAETIAPAFFDAALGAGVEHFEIETYTFDVLPEALRRDGVVASIAREYEWVLARVTPRAIPGS